MTGRAATGRHAGARPVAGRLGPICGRMLADLGADVVKLEPPEGDIIRFLQPKVGDDPVSVYFTWVERGKRSVSLDLRTERGAALVRELRVGERRGARELPPRRARASTASTPTRCWPRSPSSIYCSINGWGGDNSWSQRRAYAAMVQAEVGTGRARRPAAQRAARAEPPRRRRHHARPARGQRRSSRALFQRERTGEGQHLDVSMAEALVYTDEWTSTELAGYDGPRIPDTWNYPIFRVADGTDVAFMGDPTGRLVEIAAAISDDVVEPDRSRATRRGGILARARGARCPTSPRSKRASTCSASSCPRCAPSSSSPTRRGPTNGACSWRWSRARASPAAPFRSDRTTIGVRGPAPRFAPAHPCGARRAARALRRRARSARSRRRHPHLGRRRHRPSRLEVANRGWDCSGPPDTACDLISWRRGLEPISDEGSRPWLTSTSRSTATPTSRCGSRSWR